jgi:hypothetical protein
MECWTRSRQIALLPERDQATRVWAELVVIEQGTLALTERLYAALARKGVIKRPVRPDISWSSREETRFQS